MQFHKLLVIRACSLLCHCKVSQEYLAVLVAQLAAPTTTFLVPEHTPAAAAAAAAAA
jgi:hypothetical protein